MASERTGAKRIGSPHVFDFDCESLPIPPGTKRRARLPRGLEEELRPRRPGWLLGLAVLVALTTGVVIGRFLLP
jgi:hypothetical protein